MGLMELSSQAWNVPFVLNMVFAEGGTNDCSVHRITAKLLWLLVAVSYCRPHSTEDGGWKREKPGRFRILSQEPFFPMLHSPCSYFRWKDMAGGPPKTEQLEPW